MLRLTMFEHMSSTGGTRARVPSWCRRGPFRVVSSSMTGGQTTIYSASLSSPSVKLNRVSNADYQEFMYRVLFRMTARYHMYCDEISSPIVVRVCVFQLSKFVARSTWLTKSPIALFSFVPPKGTLDHSSITEAASDGLASRLLYGKRISPQLTSFNHLHVTSNWSQRSAAPRFLSGSVEETKELLKEIFLRVGNHYVLPTKQ